MNFQTSQGFGARGFDFLKDVDVRLSVELGRTDMKLKDVLALGEESVVLLDRLTDELLDVMVNGKVIAKGEIVAQGNRFGLRIVEMAGGEEGPKSPPPPLRPVVAAPRQRTSADAVVYRQAADTSAADRRHDLGQPETVAEISVAFHGRGPRAPYPHRRNTDAQPDPETGGHFLCRA
jgi:flagellar motor switch protein FliN/FliY